MIKIFFLLKKEKIIFEEVEIIFKGKRAGSMLNFK